jgi:hypothetical protein
MSLAPLVDAAAAIAVRAFAATLFQTVPPSLFQDKEKGPKLPPKLLEKQRKNPFIGTALGWF